jgi:hypothetical protein
MTPSCADDEACPRVRGVLRDVHDLVAETLVDTPDVIAEGLRRLEGHRALVVGRVDLAPRRESAACGRPPLRRPRVRRARCVARQGMRCHPVPVVLVGECS